MNDFFSATHEAIASACYRDLPEREHIDWKGNKYKLRPTLYEVEIYTFPQGWGSTALGYSGIGGASMTSATTVVVSDGYIWCVYFGCGRLAYKIDYEELTLESRERFIKDIQSWSVADCHDAGIRYKRKVKGIE